MKIRDRLEKYKRKIKKLEKKRAEMLIEQKKQTLKNQIAFDYGIGQLNGQLITLKNVVEDFK